MTQASVTLIPLVLLVACGSPAKSTISETGDAAADQAVDGSAAAPSSGGGSSSIPSDRVTPSIDAAAGLDGGSEPVDASALADDGPSPDGGMTSRGDGGSPMPVPATPLDPPASVALVPESERVAAHGFDLGGQRVWLHDEGHAAGLFHTIDAFDACGPARKVHVFVPRDYGESTERYPTLYFQDGHTVFWPNSPSGAGWEVAETLSALVAAARMQKTLVVAVHHGESRDREYTHVPAAPGREAGGLEGYARMLATCLRPWIDAHYRTTAAPESTGVIGSSHGGLASFWVATRHPDAFGFAGALSPSFWVGLDDLVFDRPGGPLAESPLVQPVLGVLRGPDRPRIHVDWGLERTGGIHNSRIEKFATQRGREMRDLLEGLGYGASEVSWHVAADGSHDEPSWAARLHVVLEAFGRE